MIYRGRDDWTRSGANNLVEDEWRGVSLTISTLRPWDPTGISIPSSSHQINWVPISDEEGVSHSKVSLLLQGVAIMLGPMLVLCHWFLNIIMVSPTHWAQ